MKIFALSMLVLCTITLALTGLSARTTASDISVTAMGPHMDMTSKRAMNPGDRTRANAILTALGPVMKKYADVNVAMADGFKEYKPELHLADAHFTNNAYALEAWSGHFDATHPTSLLYHRTGSGWVLQGAMYTAPPGASQAQLDEDVPLSIGQWHRHVNVCFGPPGSSMRDYLGASARFGLGGSIHDQSACTIAKGTWKAQMFGWMLHVWPLQTDPARIWALHADGHDENAMQMKMR